MMMMVNANVDGDDDVEEDGCRGDVNVDISDEKVTMISVITYNS